MFKIEELSGSLIRSGRFREAIPAFNRELQFAMNRGCITLGELFDLNTSFCQILLNPSNVDYVSELSDKMIRLAMRIPDFMPVVTSDYEENVKASREAE